MQYIESPSNDAFFNMALEEYVFEGLPKNEEYFMLWQNKNAVVVGKYQNTLAEVNRAFVDEMGIQVVRRLSGGGAMYQDMGNLNFTFVVNKQGHDNLDFSFFIRPVVKALAQMGVEAQQSSRNDIVIDGKKFSGNAQYNRQGRTMHHGTLLFNSQLQMVGKALTPPVEKIQSKGIQSVRSRVTNIANYLPRPLGMQDFKMALVQEMFAENAVQPTTLNEADLAAVQALSHNKYATWEWNWGRSPAGSLQKRRHYPFGMVEAGLQTDGGVLTGVRLAGDFFGNGDIAELEAALEGCPLQAEALQHALAEMPVGDYILGMDATTLVELLLY